MGSITKGPFDPTVTAPIDTLLGGTTSGCILIHNLSQYELLVTTPDATMSSFVAAWGWRRFDVTDPMPVISWKIAATPNQTNPPLSQVWVESYELRSDAPPQYFGQYTRQTSVGGGSVTTTTTYQLYASDNVRYFDTVLEPATGELLLQPETTDAGATGVGMALTYKHFSSHLKWLMIDANGNITIGGGASIPIVNIAGVPVAAGALGMPVVPGLTSRQHITATTLQTVLTYTPPNAGIFRISGYLLLNNAVSGNMLTAKVLYTDPDQGSSGSTTLAALSGTSTSGFTGSNSFLNGRYPIAPMVFAAAANVAIQVTYQDPTNTPSDFLTLILEQVA